MALCYNFSRVLSIVGIDRLIAYLAKRAGKSLFLFLYSPRAAATRRPTMLLARLWAQTSPKSDPGRLRFNLAA
jgi:hypothetical protein